jgi:large subunit ribosomal protein L29
MQSRELNEMNRDDLLAHITKLERTQFDDRLAHAQAQLADTGSLRRTRREIARARTLLTQKESA